MASTLRWKVAPVIETNVKENVNKVLENFDVNALLKKWLLVYRGIQDPGCDVKDTPKNETHNHLAYFTSDIFSMNFF